VEEIEKRIENLEEGLTQQRATSHMILDIIQDIDRKQDQQSIKLDIVRRRLDEQEVTLAEQSQVLQNHGELLRALAQGQQQIIALLSGKPSVND
jgi:hypothetical protein